MDSSARTLNPDSDPSLAPIAPQIHRYQELLASPSKTEHDYIELQELLGEINEFFKPLEEQQAEIQRQLEEERARRAAEVAKTIQQTASGSGAAKVSRE